MLFEVLMLGLHFLFDFLHSVLEAISFFHSSLGLGPRFKPKGRTTCWVSAADCFEIVID